MTSAVEALPGTASTQVAERSAESGARPVVVVHLLHTVAYGGIETILINWLSSLDLLDQSRVESHLVVFENPGHTEDAFIEMAENAGLKVRKIPWSQRKPVFRSSRALARILKDVGADIVHTHNVYAEIVGYLASKKSRCKVMNTLYVVADFGFKRNVQQWISMRLIRRFDLVTSQCVETMREVTSRGVSDRIQKVLISGIVPLDREISDEERTAKRRKMGVGEDELVLVNVARLYPEKAQDFLLRAFKKIHDQRPHTKLWILGSGPLEEELRALQADLGLEDAVRFLGFVSDVQSILMLTDIQVHPSHAEGVPLSICEGMRTGLPIVSTSVGGIPEMIRHEQSGLLMEAGDEDRFVQETMRMIDDAALRDRLGAGARRFIETDYSLNTAVEGLMCTYEELAAR